MKYLKQFLILTLIAWWSIPVACMGWVFAWLFEKEDSQLTFEIIIKEHWIL